MRYIYFIAAIMALASCSFSAGRAASAASETAVEVKASFNGDSAYSLVKKQVEMGPRVPGTAAHAACAEFLTAFLGQYCDTAFVQRGRVTTWDNTPLDISNIIGV
ncbi:MAG: glutamine cyclotransferase, partial [Muribaculaceae bacterium]